MAQYKLSYFPIKGLGEPIRFMLSYLGAEFEDNRVSGESWPSLKPTMPFGKLPVLEMDDKKMCQTCAIMRYLAKRANLGGKNDWEALQIDMVVDTFNDLRSALTAAWIETDEGAKAKKMDALKNETAPFYLGKFEEAVQKNGYLANTSLSWADFYFVALSDTVTFRMGWNFFEKYPNLKALKEKVEAIPSIKAWIAKRPKTDV